MTSPTDSERPKRATSGKSHLDYWLYGITKTANGLGNARLFLRAAQEESIRKLLEEEPLAFRHGKDLIEVLQTYNARLEERGVLDASGLTYCKVPGGLQVAIGEACPYRCTCDWLHSEGTAPPCFRAIAMGSVLRIVLRRGYESGLTQFGIPCQLTFKEHGMEAGDDGD